MKYLLASKKHGDIATFEYYPSGSLKTVDMLKDLNISQVLFLLTGCTIKSDLEDTLRRVKNNDPTAFLEEMPDDLSFERFWEEYGHKVGKKDRTRRKWESMPDEEKLKALKHIKKYNFFLSERPYMERKYPETFLNTAEWNN